MRGSRFQMRLEPWWRPLLLIGGATRSTAYVELGGETLTPSNEAGRSSPAHKLRQRFPDRHRRLHDLILAGLDSHQVEVLAPRLQIRH